MIFSPLRDKVGLGVYDFLRLQNNKSIIIWGGGFTGLCLSRQFHKAGFNDFYVTDSFKTPNFCTPLYDGVLSPERAINMAKTGAAIIIIAVQPVPASLKIHLIDAGLVEGKHFHSIQTLSRPSPAIEIFDPTSDTSLCIEQAVLIADRIRGDYPDVFHIDLSSNGYSFNNPEVIRIALEFEKAAPCSLALRPSNFSSSVVRDCIKLNIGNVTCIVDDCEIERALSCIESLGSILSDQKYSNSQTVVRVRFDAFESNMSGLEEIRGLCAHLEIPFLVALGYPRHYDSLVQRNGDEDTSLQPSDPIAWSFRSAKALAMKDRGLHCLCERVFPVVDASGSARLCHLYSSINLNTKYLDITKEALHVERMNALHCRTCQSQGLHRLDVAVLERRHGIQIVSDKFRKVNRK